jgi:Flp pilus assembly protein TadB
MMETAIWTVLAVGVMLGMFATCIVVVTAGVRWLENGLAKRRQKQTG